MLSNTSQKDTQKYTFASVKNNRFRVWDKEKQVEFYYDTISGYLTDIRTYVDEFGRYVIPKWRFYFQSNVDPREFTVISSAKDSRFSEDFVFKLATYIDAVRSGAVVRDYSKLLLVQATLYDRPVNGKTQSKTYIVANGSPCSTRYISGQPNPDWQKPFGLDWVVVPTHTWVEGPYGVVKVPSKERAELIEKLVANIQDFLKEDSNSPVPF